MDNHVISIDSWVESGVNYEKQSVSDFNSHYCHCGAGVWLLSNNNDKNENEGLPSSIDQYYQSKPPVYLISMFDLGQL